MGRSKRAFTLLEALVALVIFGILMTALSMALSSVLKAQVAVQSHQQDAAIVRSVFGALQRDLTSASVSKNNTASLFIAGMTGGGGARSLLMLSTLTHRIDVAGTTPGGADPSQAEQTTPQWDGALVRYDLDAQRGELHRSVVATPNPQLLMQESASSNASLISDRISSLTLRFWDASQQTWRSDWSYSNSSPAGGGSTGSGSSSSGSSGANGDTALPQAVEATLVVRRNDGRSATYTTHIYLTANTPLDLAPPSGAATGGGGTGQNGGGTGQNGAGGTGQNGGGAGTPSGGNPTGGG